MTQTIEFDAAIHNGMVRLPADHEELKNIDRAHFVVVIEKKPTTNKTLNAISLDTNGFRFDREEANVR